MKSEKLIPDFFKLQLLVTIVSALVAQSKLMAQVDFKEREKVYVNGVKSGKKVYSEEGNVKSIDQGSVIVHLNSGVQLKITNKESLLKEVPHYHDHRPGNTVFVNGITINKSIGGPVVLFDQAKVLRVYDGVIVIKASKMGKEYAVSEVDKLLPTQDEYRGIRKNTHVFVNDFEIGNKIITGTAKVLEVFKGKVVIQMDTSKRVFAIQDTHVLIPEDVEYNQCRIAELEKYDSAPIEHPLVEFFGKQVFSSLHSRN